MAALCYADKFVTERADYVSEVLIEDSVAFLYPATGAFGVLLYLPWLISFQVDVTGHLMNQERSGGLNV